MAMSIAETSVRQIGLTEQQLFNIVLYSSRATVSVVAEIAKRQATAGFISRAVGYGTLKVSADFDGVISLNPGKMFRPIVGSIRLGRYRIALNPTDVATVTQVVHVDVGHAEVSGAQWAGIDAKALRINFVVDADQLGEAGVAETAFENLVSAKIRGPAQTEHLCTRGSNRIEQTRVAASSRQTCKRGRALQAVP